MILQAEDVNFEILDVLRFKRSGSQFKTTKRDFWVLSCRTRGESRFYCDGKELTADAQHIMLLPPEVEYSQEGGAEEVICVHFKADCPVAAKARALCLPSPVLTQQFVSLHTLWQRKERGYLLRCKSILYDIILSLGERESAPERRLQPAIEYILAHFSDADFSLGSAIAAASVSPAYFRRLFKSSYGKSPVTWINELKVDYAKSLLKSRDCPMAQIAELAGFGDEKYFYTVFKKVTGVSPSRWLR